MYCNIAKLSVCVGKTPPKSRLAVDNIYSDSQLCRGHTTLPVSKRESNAAECVSLCRPTVGNGQQSFDQESSHNLSRATGHPLSSWISWITTERSIRLEDCSVPTDEVTELKMVVSDELHSDSPCERDRSAADDTSQCAKSVASLDSGACSSRSNLHLPTVDEDTQLKLEAVRLFVVSSAIDTRITDVM